MLTTLLAMMIPSWSVGGSHILPISKVRTAEASSWKRISSGMPNRTPA